MEGSQSSSILQIKYLVREQLLYEITSGLPQEVKLIAYNFSRSNMSMYSLLCRENNVGDLEWLTLRTADHSMWLKNAEQISIDLGNPADLTHLSIKIKCLFEDSITDSYYYRMSYVNLAILQLIDECQQHGIIWAVRLPEEIFAAKKQMPLDLNKEFMETDLFLGSRNNLNSLLVSVHSKKFQLQLAKIFGRNLLFSQFSGHSLLKLLPTNQWIQPIIQRETSSSNWKEIIADEYGQSLIDTCEKAINQQKMDY